MSQSSRTARARALVTLALVAVLGACDDPVAITDPPASASPSATAAAAASEEPSTAPTDSLAGAVAGPWRSRPLPATAAELGGFEAACVGADAGVAGLAVVVRDLRGEDRATLVFGEANRGRSFLCRGPSDAAAAGDVELIELDAGRDPIRDEAIDIVRYETFLDAEGDARTMLVGRVGRLAIRVYTNFPDESEAEASHGGGWYAVWWPGSAGMEIVAAVNRQNLVIGAAPPPGPPAAP